MLIIPGVPPSISLNSASNSRQGGRPTSKVFNNYSFDILGLRIISSTIYLTGSLFGFVNQKLRPTLFKTTFSQRWRWHQRGDPLGARPALVWQVDLYCWSSIWVEIYVLGYILLIIHLSWDLYSWSSIWVEIYIVDLLSQLRANWVKWKLSNLLQSIFSTASVLNFHNLSSFYFQPFPAKFLNRLRFAIARAISGLSELK